MRWVDQVEANGLVPILHGTTVEFSNFNPHGDHRQSQGGCSLGAVHSSSPVHRGTNVQPNANGGEPRWIRHAQAMIRGGSGGGTSPRVRIRPASTRCWPRPNMLAAARTNGVLLAAGSLPPVAGFA